MLLQENSRFNEHFVENRNTLIVKRQRCLKSWLCFLCMDARFIELLPKALDIPMVMQKLSNAVVKLLLFWGVFIARCVVVVYDLMQNLRFSLLDTIDCGASQNESKRNTSKN